MVSLNVDTKTWAVVELTNNCRKELGQVSFLYDDTTNRRVNQERENELMEDDLDMDLKALNAMNPRK